MPHPSNPHVALDGNTLRVTDAADPFDVWQALKAFYQDRRPISYSTAHASKYPETTVADVRQIARFFDMAVVRYVVTDGRDLHGWTTEAARWQEGRKWIKWQTEGVAASDVYLDNEKFWLFYSKRLAIQLSAMRVVPSRWEMAVESVGEAVTQLPTTIADAAQATAGAVGKTAGSLLGGLLGDIKIPLLIGAAVLGGVIVVPRLLNTKER